MEVATSLEDKEEADETPLLKEILLKSTWKILLMGFTVCLLLFLVGLGVDALIWSATPLFYSYALPLYGVGSILLYTGLVTVLSIRVSSSRFVNIWTFIMFLTQFVVAHFYVSSYYGLRESSSFNHEFYMKRQIDSMLAGNSFRSSTSVNEVMSLNDISQQEDFWLWVKGPIVDDLFCDKSAIIANKCFISDSKLRILSPIKLRTLRSSGRECNARNNISNEELSCTTDYSKDTEMLNNWGLNLSSISSFCPNNFVEFSNSNLAPIHQDGTYSTFSGRDFQASGSSGYFGSYHRGEFVFDIYPERLTDLDQVRDCFDFLQVQGFLDGDSRAVFWEVVFVAVDSMMWHAAQVQIEFATTSSIRVKTFHQHGTIATKPNNQVLMGFPDGPLIEDFLPLALVYYISLNTYALAELVQLHFFSFDGTRQSTNGWEIFDLFLVIIVYMGFAMEILAQLYTPLDHFYYDYTAAQRTQQLFLGVSILLLWAKLLKYASNTAWTSIIARTLARAVRDILMFMILFIAILTGFGRRTEEFSTIFKSMFSMARGLTGDIDAQSLYQEEPFIATVAYMAFILVMVFSMLTMLIAIINDHFVAVVLQIQQEKDEKRENNRPKEATLVTWMSELRPGTLRLELRNGRDFSGVDPEKAGNRVDLYTKIFLVDSTGTKRKGCWSCSPVSSGYSPDWQHIVEFPVVSVSDSVVFRVYDQSTSETDTYCGEAWLKIREVDVNSNKSFEFELEDKRFAARRLLYPSISISGKISASVTRTRKRHSLREGMSKIEN